MRLWLADELATLALGARIAQYCLAESVTIHLEGELGAGKTTLVRGVLRGLGYNGNVKSPTYTLLEQYQLADRQVVHIDLYRLIDAESLYDLGLDDYLNDDKLCLIEWAIKGKPCLPQPDVIITMRYHGTGRYATLSTCSVIGDECINRCINN